MTAVGAHCLAIACAGICKLQQCAVGIAADEAISRLIDPSYGLCRRVAGGSCFICEAVGNPSATN